MEVVRTIILDDAERRVVAKVATLPRIVDREDPEETREALRLLNGIAEHASSDPIPRGRWDRAAEVLTETLAVIDRESGVDHWKCLAQEQGAAPLNPQEEQMAKVLAESRRIQGQEIRDALLIVRQAQAASTPIPLRAKYQEV